jgi:hypothetical protein
MSVVAKKKSAVKPSNLVKRASTIYRHSEPNIYDQAAQGTHCIVADKDIYIQNSPDENNPCWVLVGPYSPPQQKGGNP